MINLPTFGIILSIILLTSAVSVVGLHLLIIWPPAILGAISLVSRLNKK